jgi:hypothetical protein
MYHTRFLEHLILLPIHEDPARPRGSHERSYPRMQEVHPPLVVSQIGLTCTDTVRRMQKCAEGNGARILPVGKISRDAMRVLINPLVKIVGVTKQTFKAMCAREMEGCEPTHNH